MSLNKIIQQFQNVIVMSLLFDEMKFGKIEVGVRDVDVQ